MNENSRRGVLEGLMSLMTLTAGTAQAQDFPNQPIKLIAGFAPGSAVDFIARALDTQARVRPAALRTGLRGLAPALAR